MLESQPLHLTNPFEAAYLGIETADTEASARITIRVPKRWLDMASQFSQDPRLPFNNATSAVFRAAIIRYLHELATANDQAEMMLYLQAASQLRHAAFKRNVEFESRRHIASFETALSEAARKKRPHVINDTLTEIRQIVERTRSETWRTDLELIIAGSEPIKRAARYLIDTWALSTDEAEERAARLWGEWLAHLEGALYGS